MIPDNLELLFKSDEYHYYAREEIGFSNKNFARKNKLYGDFGDYYSSTYFDIFTMDLYSDRKMTQLWVFKDKKPIGLFLGIHYIETKTLIDQENNLPSNIIGEMHLFTLPEYRNKGIAKNSIPILENLMLTKTDYPPCLIMQDDAYPLGKYLKKSLALPKNYNYGVCLENQQILNDKYTDILDSKTNFKLLVKQFPSLNEYQTLNIMNNSINSFLSTETFNQSATQLKF